MLHTLMIRFFMWSAFLGFGIVAFGAQADEPCTTGETHSFPVGASSVDLSADGSRVAFSSGHQVTVAEVDSGKAIILPGLGQYNNDSLLVVLSDDGTRLASLAMDGHLTSWNVETGQALSRHDVSLPMYSSPISNVRYLPTGHFAEFMLTADNAVTFINVMDGSKEYGIDLGSPMIFDIASDGERVLVGNQVLDLGTGVVLTTLPNLKEFLQTFMPRFSRDGSRVIYAEDVIKVWDAGTGTLLHSVPSPLGTLASWDAGNGVIVLGGEDTDDPIIVATLETLETLYTIPTDGFIADWTVMCKDGSRFVVSDGHRIRVYATATGALVREFLPGSSASYSRDLQRYAFAAPRWAGIDPMFLESYPNALLVVRDADGSERRIETEASDDIFALALSPDGSLIASYEYPWLRVREVATGSPVFSFKYEGTKPYDSQVLLSEDNGYLLYRIQSNVWLAFSLATPDTKLFSWRGELAFIPGTTPARVLRAKDLAVDVYNVATQGVEETFTLANDVGSLAVAADASAFIGVYDTVNGEAFVSNLDSGEVIQTFAPIPEEPYVGVALSSDGGKALLLTVVNFRNEDAPADYLEDQYYFNLRVADVATGTITRVIENVPSGRISFSPDDSLIVFEGTVAKTMPVEICVPEGEDGTDGEGTIEAEGTVEGTIEGSVEGNPEGTIEGDVDGEGVIEGEGSSDGEGMTEGLPEGEGVAEGEGTIEGVAEGEGEALLPAAQVLAGFRSADANGDQRLSAAEFASISGGTQVAFDALDTNDDGVLSIAELQRQVVGASPLHSADTNADALVTLAELIRVVQLRNAGGYDCAANPDDSEDGYLLDADGALSSGCPAHASDYLETDGVISLSELLRLIQLYNSGVIAPCESSEDGFCAAV